MNKIAYVFPGQGSQYVGMGKDLYEHYEASKKVFDTADARLEMDLSKLCFEGQEAELALTWNAQPGIMAMSLALLALVKERQIPEPDYAAGHSLGEYTALVSAGVLATGDALWLVHQRGRYMAQASPPGQGGMAALIGGEKEQIEALCQAASAFGTVQPANFNGGGQIVVSGHMEAVRKAADMSGDFGVKRGIMLQVTGPFHSALMEPVGQRLKTAMDQLTFADARIPVIANVDAAPERDAGVIRDHLIRQLSGAVLWEQSVKKMIELGVDTFVEIGPKRVLTGLIKKIDASVQLINIEDAASLDIAAEIFAKG
jgi:[acyl-carrier-protein] S-malonyltransferase